VPAGTTVKVGQVVGAIETEAAAAEEKIKFDAPADAASATSEDEIDKASQASIFNLMMPSPAARKLLAENRLSAKDITGSGRDGRITKADVLTYIEKLEKEEAAAKRAKEPVAKPAEPAPAPARTAPAPERPAMPTSAPLPMPAAPAAAPARPAPAAGARQVRREKMTRIRKTIAQRLVKTTQELAMLTTFNEVDMSGVMGIRSKYKEAFTKRHEVNLGFMSFFTKAVCLALQQQPIVNAMVDGDDIVYHDYSDIGIAVSTPRGLVVPIIRNAEALSFHQIEATIVELANRGRDGKLSLEELTGGTFTITNGGIFGSMLSTPLVNYPQSAILGMHNIVERPVVRDGQIVIRPIMYVALSYDHRIIDGADAVRFLVRVKELLEDPVRLMLQV
jgi:2-oxoglutarate dehydrogenase E2 component (dihydrolipoamide succinyltransferase)